MEFLFWFFGVFCLAYYGVIVCYSGPSTSFAPIWLVLSACLFIIATVVPVSYTHLTLPTIA